MPKPKRKDKKGNGDEKLTKVEKAVATHVRFNCPTKTTLFAGNEVHYFKASEAVDCLLESKWSTGKRRTTVLFSNKKEATDYMQGLMDKGLFWRARKLVPKRKPREDGDNNGDNGNNNENNNAAQTSSKDKDRKKGDKDEGKSPKKKDKKTEKAAAEKDTEKEDDKEEKDEKKDENNEDESGKKKSRKARKVKLDFHHEQLFTDSGGSDVFVWHFDPISWTKLLIGLAIVLGSIGVCLFPLWPPWLQKGIYYVSILAMVFVGVLLGLIVLRSIIFGLVWAASLGKHHFWILPNLTEDCGFLDSFKPAYSYEYKGGGDGEDEGGDGDGDGGGGVKKSKDDEGDDEKEKEKKTGDKQEGEGDGEEEDGEKGKNSDDEDDDDEDDDDGAQTDSEELDDSEALLNSEDEEEVGDGEQGSPDNNQPRQRKGGRKARRENDGFEMVN